VLYGALSGKLYFIKKYETTRAGIIILNSITKNNTIIMHLSKYKHCLIYLTIPNKPGTKSKTTTAATLPTPQLPHIIFYSPLLKTHTNESHPFT
jgi:hypothetical protein